MERPEKYYDRGWCVYMENIKDDGDRLFYRRRNKIEIIVSEQPESTRHFHQDIEVLYVLEGELYLKIGDCEIKMRKEDIYIINANTTHSFCVSEDVLYAKITITYQIYSDIYRNEPFVFVCDSTSENEQKKEAFSQLRHRINNFLNCYLKLKGKTASFKYISLGYLVLDTISDYFLFKLPENNQFEQYDKVDTRICLINNYIRNNYRSSIALKDLADQLFLSEAYCSRFFKKMYGMTFSDYLTNIRLHHAVEDLIYTDMPVTKIVYDNGFSSQTFFSRKFKSIYDETPANFRKHFRNESDQLYYEKLLPEKDQKLQAFLEKRLSSHVGDGSEQEKSESEVFEVGQWSLEEKTLFQTINVGMAEYLLRSEVREQLKDLKKMLGIKYIRFCNLFTPELMVNMTEDVEKINFSKINQIFDYLHSEGFRVHLEIGMKQQRQMRDLTESVDTRFEKKRKPMISIEKWKVLVNTVIRHLANRYKSEIDTWRIELWYDEDAWEETWTMPQYFEQFSVLYQIVRRYSDQIEIGGCGLKFDYLENNITNFLEQWQAQTYRPDFISVLFYAYERGTAICDASFRRSMDMDYMKKCIAKINGWMSSAGMIHTKLYISEWNFTISDRNYINDTCFKSAYIVKNLIDIYDLAQDNAYYLAGDAVAENFDTSAIMFGGTGLMTRDGIIKPSGYAFYFMSRMYPYKIVASGNTMLTTDGKNDYTLIMHHLTALNDKYYFTKEDAVLKEELQNYFADGKHMKKVIELKGLKNGEYLLKLYRINRHNGSVLDIWREMAFEEELSKEDVRYLKEASHPKMTMERIYVKTQDFRINVMMDINEVIYIQMLYLL